MTLNEMFEEHGIYLGSLAFRAIEDVAKVYIQQELDKERLRIIGSCSDREEGLHRRIADLENQVEKGRNIVHRLLVVIQRHKWWNYEVIDEARAFMSEVDRD